MCLCQTSVLKEPLNYGGKIKCVDQTRVRDWRTLVAQQLLREHQVVKWRHKQGLTETMSLEEWDEWMGNVSDED